MEIRFITPDEAVPFLKVSSASFIWKFDAEVDTHVDMPVMAAFHEGKLIAGVEVHNFKTNYCGNFLNAIVPSGVCSLPEYRRMGGIKEIFNELGRIAVEKDWAFGFLAPFSISYYEKFGYANLNRMFSVKVPFSNMNSIPRNTDAVLYDGSQYEELDKLHSECALRENLLTLRNDKKYYCDTPYEETDYTYIHRDNSGKADGYVRFKVKRPDELIVDELFTLNPDALISLVGFLRNYDCIVKYLVVKKQYQGSPFSCLADRISDVTYEYGGGSAGRIYNLQKILENNKYPDEYGHFRLLSLDDLPQNKGIFEVEYQNGKAEITHKESGEYDIALNAPAAARLLLAGEGHTADSAIYINGTQLHGNADGFFKAFPHRPTCFSDSDI